MAKRTDRMQFYMNRHPNCESCNFEATECHHIITRKTLGSDDDANFLALCHYCHTAFHMMGRRTFAERYPHLSPKIEAACQRQGRKF